MSGPTGRPRPRAPATAPSGRRPDRWTIVPPPPPAPRACSFNASIGATRVARSAGAVPNSTAVSAVTDAVNASTRQSSTRSRNTRSTVVDNCATSARLPHDARITPITAPHPERTRLSVSPCRARRQRDAPSATPHAHFVAAGGGPREQQVGDVRARDQQDQRDDREDRQQRPAVLQTQRRCTDAGRHERERIVQEFLAELRIECGSCRRRRAGSVENLGLRAPRSWRSRRRTTDRASAAA